MQRPWLGRCENDRENRDGARLGRVIIDPDLEAAVDQGTPRWRDGDPQQLSMAPLRRRDGHGESGGQTPGYHQYVFFGRFPGQQNEDLGAKEPDHGVVSSHVGAQAMGRRHHDLIGYRRAVAAADLGQAIQANEDQGHRLGRRWRTGWRKLCAGAGRQPGPPSCIR